MYREEIEKCETFTLIDDVVAVHHQIGNFDSCFLMLTLKRKRELAVAVAANVVAALELILDLPDDDEGDEFTLQYNSTLLQCEEMIAALQTAPKPGRGHTVDGMRLPTLMMPSSSMYEDNVRNAERFQSLCRFTPAEFEDLHTDVLDVLLMVRDCYHTFTESENKLRKKRRFKYSSRERLFHFLVYMTHYQTLNKGSTDFGLSRAALHHDVHWLREQLSVHRVLVAEVQWGTPAEVESERQLLVSAGLLSHGFENVVFLCDGTKDLSRRLAHYNRSNEPDYSQKGNGKSTLLVGCLHPMCCSPFSRVVVHVTHTLAFPMRCSSRMS